MEKNINVKTLLKVLYLEDSLQDVELMSELLTESGYDLSMDCTDKQNEFTSYLRNNTYDIILSDFKLPEFNALRAIQLSMDICPNVPFICISGSIGEETAIELIRKGAVDYILKDRTARLPLAIRRALDEAKEKEARHNAEKLLRESEERYRGIFENVQDVYYEASIDGIILEVSPSIKVISKGGYSREDLIGKSMDDFYSISDGRRSFITLLQERSSVADYEIILKNRDGSNVPCSISAKIQFDTQGMPFKIIGSLRDITERKQAEELLRESEERFRSLYENSTMGLYRTTPDGKIILANSALINILGYSSFEELAKRDLQKDGFEPNYKRESFIELIEKNGFVKGLESVWTKKDGTVVYVSESASIIRDTYGKTLYYDGTVENITERKIAEESLQKSETMLEEAMKIAKLGTWEYDVALDQFTFNDQFYILFRTTAEREGGYIMSSAQYAKKFVHPDDMHQVGEETRKALETNDPDYYAQLDHRIICADGEIRNIAVHIRIKKDAHGNTVKTFGVNQDITERIRTEETLRNERQLFRTLIDNIPDSIYSKDVLSRIMIANPADVRNLGAKSEAEVLGKDDFYFYPKELAEGFFADDQLVLQA
jgi:PAS domain S-box-containing protein